MPHSPITASDSTALTRVWRTCRPASRVRTPPPAIAPRASRTNCGNSEPTSAHRAGALTDSTRVSPPSLPALGTPSKQPRSSPRRWRISGPGSMPSTSAPPGARCQHRRCQQRRHRTLEHARGSRESSAPARRGQRSSGRRRNARRDAGNCDRHGQCPADSQVQKSGRLKAQGERVDTISKLPRSPMPPRRSSRAIRRGSG